MKTLLLLLVSATAAIASPEADEIRKRADAAEKEGRMTAASELYEKAAEVSLLAGDRQIAFRDLHRAGIKALRGGAIERAVSITRRAITLADELVPGLTGIGRKAVHLGRIDCRGICEYALWSLDRFAEGYAENRSIWRDIEQYRVAEEGGAPGDPRQADDLARWSPGIRFYFWMASAREADYLDIMGHTAESLAVLRRAARQSSSLGRLDDHENIYAAQIRKPLAFKLEFLGYRREAIEIQRAALADPDVRLTGALYWGARMDLLYSVQKYEGPSRAKLDEAEECLREMARLSPFGRRPPGAIVVEEMRADYAEHYDAAGNRRPLAIATPQDGRPFLDRSRRPLAIELRQDGKPSTARQVGSFLVEGPLKPQPGTEFIGSSEPGLDGEFVRLLHETRKRGDKHGEPGLYQVYASYLRRIGRPTEALPLYREALRLTESFGWVLHTPRLRLYIIGTLYDLGDLAGAEAEWATMERQIAGIADVPVKIPLDFRGARIEWYRLRGENDKARAALNEARAFADAQKVSAWDRRALDAIQLDAGAVAAVPQPAAPVVATEAPAPVSLQPSRVVTSAAPGDALRARFALRNPDGRTHTGEFRARGPAIQLGLSTAPRRITGTAAAGGAENELRLPIVLAPGEELGVVLEMKRAPAEGAKSAWQIAWHEGRGATAAGWHITTERDPFVVSVLNASQLRRNAFHSVSFTHQIVRRADGPGLVNIRFVASTPLRLEYYDAATHRLLAVDAEGNGVFTDPGDALLADKDSNLAPDVEFDGRERLREIEIVVFSTATAPAAGRQAIVAEILTEKGWEKVARNDLE